MKLGNISLLLVAVTLIAIATSGLFATAGLAQNVTATPRVGPTAYLPGASPAAAPGVSVETRNVSTPAPGAAAVPAPSVTVAPVVTATPAPAAGGATSAEIVNYGTDSDTFKRGDRASGFITVKNTGNTSINDITTSVSASVKLPVIGATDVGNKDYTFNNLNIGPGETKRVEFTVDIPSEYKGVSTAGDYDLHVTAKTGGRDIGSFTKSVKVT
jgi:hypothetical protein